MIIIMIIIIMIMIIIIIIIIIKIIIAITILQLYKYNYSLIEITKLYRFYKMLWTLERDGMTFDFAFAIKQDWNLIN